MHKRLCVCLALVIAATPARAVECRIGPVSIDIPACDIRSEGKTQYVEWKADESGTRATIILTPAKSRSFAGYFDSWRHQHKCTAEKRKVEHPITPANGTPAPPQITWEGICVNRESYRVQAIGLKGQVVELHAFGDRMRGARPDVAFAKLLDQVRLAP